MLMQQLVNGLTLGAVYTLIALSFSLVMGVLSVLNIAIGELFMLGGYFGFALIGAHFPLPVALLGGMVGATVVSVVIQKVAYEARCGDAPLITPMLSTLGFSIILQNIVTNVWGSDPLQLPAEDVRQTPGLRTGLYRRHATRRLGVTVVLVAAVAISSNARRPAARFAPLPKTATSPVCLASRPAASPCSPLRFRARSPAPPVFSSACITRRSRLMSASISA